MSRSRKTYHYDLTKITEFPQSLIYTFQHEAGRATDQEDNHLDSFLHGINQYEDMFNAYHHAQNTILKTIREKGLKSVTPELIAKWLNDIHKQIAKTMAEDIEEPKLAGQYTDAQLVRWHQTSDAREVLMLRFLIDKGYVARSFESITGNRFYNRLRELDVPLQAAEDFVNLMHRVSDDETIILSDRDQARIDSFESIPMKITERAFSRIVTGYLSKQLNEKDMNIVDKVMMICPPPEKLPLLMQKFTNEMLKRWKKCDKNDIQSVSELCSWVFFSITDIHPYFNCNGRTATCWINILLRSFDLPAILIREPGERENKESSYSMAVEKLGVHSPLLTSHIHDRILLAKNGKIYKNSSIQNTIAFRIELAKYIYSIRTEFPRFDLESFWQKQETLVFASFNKLLSENKIPPSLAQPTIISELLVDALKKTIFGKLTDLRSARLLKKSLSSIWGQTNIQENKQRIAEKLADLTGLSGWKCYRKNGSLQALLITNSSDTTKALAAALNGTEAVSARKMLVTDSKKPAVLVQSINFEQLNKLQEIDGWTLHPKSKSLATNKMM